MNDKPKTYFGTKLSKVDLFGIGLFFASFVGFFYALLAISDFALALILLTISQISAITMKINEVCRTSLGVLVFLIGCLAVLLSTLTSLIIQYPTLKTHNTMSSGLLLVILFVGLLSSLSTYRMNKQNAARREQQLLDTAKADPFTTSQPKPDKAISHDER